MKLIMQSLLALLLLVGACSSSQTESDQGTDEATVETNKVLIVYLSRTNNTKAIAEIIQRQAGGKLIALELENPYPKTTGLRWSR